MIGLGGFTAYFDASRQEQQGDKLTVVAGFLSTVEAWEQWEAEWRLILAKFDVPHFHMKDFVAHRRAFSGPKWRIESYRATFLAQLIKCVNDWSVASVGGAIRQSVFERFNRRFELDKRFNPYAIVGRDCAAHVRNFVRNQLKSELPVAYVFDQGDEGQGLLTAEMEASGLPSPVFSRSRPDPLKDKDDPPAIQLQACDLLAWEVRRGENDVKDRGKRGGELRKSLLALRNVKHRLWHGCDDNDLDGLCRVANINERSQSAYETFS